MVVFIARRERAAVHDGRCCALPCSRNLQQQPATTVDAAAICCCCCCLQQKRLWSRVATRTGMKSAKLQRETRYIATRVAGVRGCFFFCCVSMHARERERPFLLLRQQTNRSHTHTHPLGRLCSSTARRLRFQFTLFALFLPLAIFSCFSAFSLRRLRMRVLCQLFVAGVNIFFSRSTSFSFQTPCSRSTHLSPTPFSLFFSTFTTALRF